MFHGYRRRPATIHSDCPQCGKSFQHSNSPGVRFYCSPGCSEAERKVAGAVGPGAIAIRSWRAAHPLLKGKDAGYPLTLEFFREVKEWVKTKRTVSVRIRVTPGMYQWENSEAVPGIDKMEVGPLETLAERLAYDDRGAQQFMYIVNLPDGKTVFVQGTEIGID
jgi:hypothetical protein